MSKFLAARRMTTLVPTDAAGEAIVRELGHGEIVQTEITHPRNLKFHQRYWVLLTLVWENIEGEAFPTVDDFHEAVKMMVGLRVRYWLPPGAELTKPNGEPYKVGAGGIELWRPGTIRFSKMDEASFRKFYENVSDLLAKFFLPGVKASDLRKQVEELLVTRR